MSFGSILVLIRHAAASHNDGAALCGGFCDAALTRRGKAQVEALRRRLAQASPASVCYSSPLGRAIETALAAPPPLLALRLDTLREIHVGPAQYPDHWRSHLARLDDDFAWPGGET